jgi:hypothetical protein
MHPESLYHHNKNVPFTSPMSNSNAMQFNRGRAFSAGANNLAPYYQAVYYDDVSSSNAAANRQRCATVSPPGMSRLHEDQQDLFSNNDRERLAIPPLSEPRPRLRSACGLGARDGAAVDAPRDYRPPSASTPAQQGERRRRRDERIRAHRQDERSSAPAELPPPEFRQVQVRLR